MRFTCLLPILVLGAQTAAAGIIYTQTPTGFVAAIAEMAAMDDSEVSCSGAKGCLQKESPGGGVLPRIAPITYDFAVSADEKKALTKNPDKTYGRLMITASRDIGLRAAAAGGFLAPEDWIVVAADAIASTKGDQKNPEKTGFGLLFLMTKSNCGPNNERVNFKEGCGPNYHTDVKASDSILIAPKDFQKLIGADKITLVLSPSGGEKFTGVGLLKIFDAKLEAFEIPEPTTLLLAATGLGLIAMARRRA